MKHHEIIFPGKAFNAREDKHPSFIDLVNITADIAHPKSVNPVKAAADRQLILNRY